MTVQSACQVPTTRLHPAAKLRRPKCPRCGSVVLVAEESRFNAGGFNAQGRVDHIWSCDDCGNAFVTSIRLWRP